MESWRINLKGLMMKMLNWVILPAATVSIFSIQALAVPQLRLSDGTVAGTITVVDQGPGDANTVLGAITYVGVVGPKWTVNVTTGLAKPAVGSAVEPYMEIGGFNISSQPNAVLTIELTDQDFMNAGNAEAVIGGTTEGSVTFRVWTDPGNGDFAKTSLLTSLGPFAATPFDGTTTATFQSPIPYSMTLQVVINHPVPGRSGFNAAIEVEGAHAGCRVTGGSNHQTNSWQSACIITPLPNHISHGGQVGAPFAGETPFTPNSPCISGEWQHNRHENNGNKLVGNFHAAGNGHVREFDSLLCACLPCDENPGAVGVVGEVCNPGDRICGPEPRRAPANKICFSGVGDYTFTNGKKTVKAVFRVDIEDRSEGNSHSSTLPLDRYRIRLWILDPACGRDPDPSTPANMALRFAASADPTKIAVLATTEDLKVNITPDIDDGGNMTQGNHQIHPVTGAICDALIPFRASVEAAAEVAAITPGSPNQFGTTASAYKIDTDPPFAHRVTILNDGTATLGNLAVFETRQTALEDTTPTYFSPGATLASGEAVTLTYTNTLPSNTVHTIVVTGNSVENNNPVIAASTYIASVLPGDTTPPVLACPASFPVNAPLGQCSAIVSYTVSATDDFPGEVTTSCAPPSGATFPQGSTTVNCTARDSWNNQGACSFSVTVNGPQFTLSAPNPLPAIDTSLNVLSGPAGFAAYAWSVTGTGWQITSGATSQNVTYTAGAGAAVFRLIATAAAGCKSTNQISVVPGNSAGSSAPAFWASAAGVGLVTAADLSALNALRLRNAKGGDVDFKGSLAKARSSLQSFLNGRSSVNMSHMLSAHLACTRLNLLKGFANGATVVSIGGCGNLNGGSSITLNDLVTLANKALIADGNTPAGDPNRALQECYKNALANANAATLRP